MLNFRGMSGFRVALLKMGGFQGAQKGAPVGYFGGTLGVPLSGKHPNELYRVEPVPLSGKGSQPCHSAAWLAHECCLCSCFGTSTKMPQPGYRILPSRRQNGNVGLKLLSVVAMLAHSNDG